MGSEFPERGECYRPCWRRCQRVFFSSFLCFFFRIFLRRFLTSDGKRCPFSWLLVRTEQIAEVHPLGAVALFEPNRPQSKRLRCLRDGRDQPEHAVLGRM